MAHDQHRSLTERLYRTTLAGMSYDDVRLRVRAAVEATRGAGDGVTAEVVEQRVIEIPEQRTQSPA